MKFRINHILFVLLFIALPSCRAIDGFIHDFIHDDELVARVSGHELYRSTVKLQIPHGLTVQDSLEMANRIIETWARDKVCTEMADKQLSKKEKDVTKELEEYREALLKYRYEQRYINERLDTVVQDAEIEKYYKTHLSKFALEAPIGKISLYTCLTKNTQSEIILKKDWDGNWVDFRDLAREYGADHLTLLAHKKDDRIVMNDENGVQLLTEISEFVPQGKPAPLDYCWNIIREIIINGRKHQLSTTLERELLDNARANGTLKIYSTEK